MGPPLAKLSGSAGASAVCCIDSIIADQTKFIYFKRLSSLCTGVDPGFLDRGLKFAKGGSICLHYLI